MVKLVHVAYVNVKFVQFQRTKYRSRWVGDVYLSTAASAIQTILPSLPRFSEAVHDDGIHVRSCIISKYRNGDKHQLSPHSRAPFQRQLPARTVLADGAGR